jgi:hypothetical protein
VVRRPASVLIAAHAALFAYLLITPALPAVGGTGDVNTLVSDGTTLVLLAGCVLAVLPARDEPFALALLALGSGLLAAGATEGGSILLAGVTKTLFSASLGMLLARLLAEPAVVVGVPLFVAGIDVASVAGGPSALLARDSSQAGEFLSVYLPAWGGGRAGVLGVADLIFLAFFAASAWRFGLRRRVTGAALALALPAAVAVQLALDVTIPALPILAAALLVPNLDLLPRLLARQRSG